MRPADRQPRVLSIAATAPSPSNTAPKASAARMIHMNMQEMASVLRVATSNTSRVKLRFSTDINSRNSSSLKNVGVPPPRCSWLTD